MIIIQEAEYKEAGKDMKPMDIVYWLRLALGIVAALVCIGYGIAAGRIPHNPPQDNFPIDTSFFMNSLSIALVTYLVSYYIVKRRFMLKVEKPQKLVTMGIGIYFLAWIVFLTLLYTLVAGPPIPT